MENATKALIIAASILIVIVLIAISLKILAPATETTEDIGKVTETLGVSTFNSQFTKYSGIQTGTQLRSLLNLVMAHNASGSSHMVYLRIVDAPGLTNRSKEGSPEGISDIIGEVNVNSTYKITLRNWFKRDDAYIDLVKIESP